MSASLNSLRESLRHKIIGTAALAGVLGGIIGTGVPQPAIVHPFLTKNNGEPIKMHVIPQNSNPPNWKPAKELEFKHTDGKTYSVYYTGAGTFLTKEKSNK